MTRNLRLTWLEELPATVQVVLGVIFSLLPVKAGTDEDDTFIGGNRSDYIFGLGGNDTLFGLGDDDLLFGSDGDDILDGGSGADIMFGGTGNDLYFVDNVGDQIAEFNSQGTDRVLSSISYTLSDNVENLDLTGSAITGTGNSLDNYITGNNLNNSLSGGEGNDLLFGGDGDDILDGGSGADIMFGGTGNDIYFVDNVSDQIAEFNSQGTDRVVSSISYTLSDNVENLDLTGSAITGTGNSLDNYITGNNLNNSLSGGEGNDSLFGGEGDDTLDGGIGNDLFLGSLGSDKIIGGDGIDIVDYSSFDQGVTLKLEYDFIDTTIEIPTSAFPRYVAVIPSYLSTITVPAVDSISALRVVKPKADSNSKSIEKDTLESLETIIGSAGQTNTIDFGFDRNEWVIGHPNDSYYDFPAFSFNLVSFLAPEGLISPDATAPSVSYQREILTPSINVDLAAQQLTYGGTTLTVKNFTNVIGSKGSDNLLGDDQANVLDGLTGNNSLNGRGGDDILHSYDDDTLTGGEGADRFILNSAFKFIENTYSNERRISYKPIDRVITDFTPGEDVLILKSENSFKHLIIGTDSVSFASFWDLRSGPLAPELFVESRNGPLSLDTLLGYDGALLYENGTGDLFYLGSSPFDPFLKVATLQGAPNLTASDILVI